MICCRLFKECKFPKARLIDFVQSCSLSPHQARQVYRKASLHPPRHPLTAAIKGGAVFNCSVSTSDLERSEVLKYHDCLVGEDLEEDDNGLCERDVNEFV